MSDPMCAASNSHSPNRCRMLLHLGRADASDGRFSLEIDKIDVRLPAEAGPELGAITVLILAERLLVKLIKDPFESPALRLKFKSISGGRKSTRWGGFNNDVKSFDAFNLRTNFPTF